LAAHCRSGGCAHPACGPRCAGCDTGAASLKARWSRELSPQPSLRNRRRRSRFARGEAIPARSAAERTGSNMNKPMSSSSTSLGDDEQPRKGVAEAGAGSCRTASTIFTSQMQPASSAGGAASTAQEYLSEASHLTGMVSNESSRTADASVPAMLDWARMAGASPWASEVAMGPHSSVNDEPKATTQTLKQRGRPPFAPAAPAARQQHQAPKDVDARFPASASGTFESEGSHGSPYLSEGVSERSSYNQQPPMQQQSSSAFDGGGLTIGSLPCMRESEEQAETFDCLSTVQVGTLTDTLVKATAAAAREAVSAQLALLLPQLMQAFSSKSDPYFSSSARPIGSENTNQEDACSVAGSISDMMNMRSVESHVADSILERGLSEGQSPMPSQRDRWRSHGSNGDSQSPMPSARGRWRSHGSNAENNQSPMPSQRDRWRSHGSSPSPTPPCRTPVCRGVLPSAPACEPKKLDLSVALPHALQELVGQAAQEDEASMGDMDSRRSPQAAGSASDGHASLALAGRTRAQQSRVSENRGGLRQEDDRHPNPNPSWRRSRRSAPPVFRFCGLTPWSASRRPRLSRLYRLVLLVVGVVILGGILFEALRLRDDAWSARPTCSNPQSSNCWQQRGLFSLLPLVASVVGVIALFLLPQRSNTFSNTLSLLQAYLMKHELQQMVRIRIAKDAWTVFGLWVLISVCASVGTALDNSTGELDVYSLPYLLAIVLIGGFAAAWTYCMIYICHALAAIIDRFCIELTNTQDISQAMKQWNILQAVMLKTSSSVEWSFIPMLLAIAFAVPLLMADFLTLGADWGALPPIVPGALIMLLFVRAFLVAASITDKCARVPALVNSLCFGPGMEHRRYLLVNFIGSSGAGFYVCEIRLTMAVAMKFMYMWSIVACGLATNLLASIGY